MYTKLIKMKMNTTLFIGLFFSIIIATKVRQYTWYLPILFYVRYYLCEHNKMYRIMIFKII